MFLSLFLFFLLFGLTSINFLVFASIKFDSFPFHMSFCSFFHTCTISLVEAIALWTWKATSGMSYPRSETVFFFLFLVLFWRSPHILLPLRSYSAFFLIWLQFGFCLFTDRKNQMKPNTAATRDRSRSQILDETHEHLLVRSSSHHIRHVIRHFQSLEVKASAITPSDYENISTWRPACQLLEDLTVSCQFKGHTKLAVFHILEKNLFRKLEVIKSDPVISVLSESRSRIAHSLLTEAEQPVDTVLEDNLDDIYQDEILYTLLPQESRKRNGFEWKIRRFIQIPSKKSALHSVS